MTDIRLGQTVQWCGACRSTGAIHCAHPDECGGIKSYPAPHIQAAQIADLTAKLAEMESARILEKAERDGLASLLLSVQQDCIEAVNSVTTARIEGYEIAREQARDCGWHLLRPDLVEGLK